MYTIQSYHVQSSIDDSQNKDIGNDNWENQLDSSSEGGGQVEDDDMMFEEHHGLSSKSSDVFTIIKKKESTKSLLKMPSILNTSWTFYYHDPENSKWSIDSYIKIQSFNTIDDFWSIYSKLPSRSFHLGMFFLMRNNILPTWEDPANMNGGCWSYKISILDVYQLWLDLSIYTVSEHLSKKNQYITGISISPKKGFCIVKIWNSNSSHCENSQLTKNIKCLEHDKSLYTPFKNKK